ncbi:phospholipase A2 [Trichomycterus rosablanca]|uniref:phospholipase A2 n=1 Tax=Trichomycterus rosablanca TaxID=2290929 RepID=UPI002F35B312
MKLSWILLVSTVCVAQGGHVPRALWQFGRMINCVQPSVNPLKYNNYGCYCGLSGSGDPKDQLDQCCFEHDTCYYNARVLKECPTIADLPHIKVYDFTCSDKTLTCSDTNDKCQAVVCECDRVAANCFARYNHIYNPDYKNLSKEDCKN